MKTYWTDDREFPVFSSVMKRFPSESELNALLSAIPVMKRTVMNGGDPRSVIEGALRYISHDLAKGSELWPLTYQSLEGRRIDSMATLNRLDQRLRKCLKRIKDARSNNTHRTRVTRI